MSQLWLPHGDSGGAAPCMSLEGVVSPLVRVVSLSSC